MRSRTSIVLAAAALLFAGSARAAEAGDEAAKSYRILTTGSTQSLSAGQKGKLVLVIEPAVAKVHVNAQAPLKIKLEAAPGLKLEKDQLAHADAVQVGAPAPRFEIPFTAVTAGKQEAKAQLDFYICSDAWCVKQVRDVVMTVDVK
jgi:hypothetical protein